MVYLLLLLVDHDPVYRRLGLFARFQTEKFDSKETRRPQCDRWNMNHRSVS